jgi:Tfp pilus assembly protein PilO
MQAFKESWVVLAILAAMVLGATVVVYLPQGRELEGIKSEIAQTQIDIETDAQQVASVPALVRQIETMRNQYKDFDRKLPKRKDLGEFLRQINGSIASENLTNQLIEPGNPVKEELFHTLPIIMRFKGSYMSMASFLNRIDNMERLTRVQKLVISTGPDALNFELQMNIYFTES